MVHEQRKPEIEQIACEVPCQGNIRLLFGFPQILYPQPTLLDRG